MVAQSPDLWDNQEFSRDMLITQNESDIGWMESEDCLGSSIKESQYGDYNNTDGNLLGEDSLCNSFYDCSELDENMHCYLLKGLIGESRLGEDTELGISMGVCSKDIGMEMDIQMGMMASGDSPSSDRCRTGDTVCGRGDGNVAESRIIRIEESQIMHFNPMISDLETGIFDCDEKRGVGDVFVKQQVENNRALIHPSIPCGSPGNLNGGSASSLSQPCGLSPGGDFQVSFPTLLSQSESTSTLPSSLSTSARSEISLKKSLNSHLEMGNSNGYGLSSYELDDGVQKKIRVIDPKDCIKMGILDSDIQEVEFGLEGERDHGGYEYGCNKDTESLQNCYSGHQGYGQVTELDSSKGRRWSNNSTTSTISSNFSTSNANKDTRNSGIPGQIFSVAISEDNLAQSQSEEINLGVAGGVLGVDGLVKKETREFCRNVGEFVQSQRMNDSFCNTGTLNRECFGGVSEMSKSKNLQNNIVGTKDNIGSGSNNYEMNMIDEDHYHVDNSVENEYYLGSNNYLTEDEKLKLRRRGRRRRPGEIEAWKTIIPRTTVDEAEHFVQTSQYRMRHVYRDPRAVSFVYRCVQHVDCQYEMRIYLTSHETCYVQHRGYHTEEKQKYKRPGLPQHTLPLIDELIRKGLPPKSVIDHAIQVYPEVADQSNISVLYRQITNRQQYIRKRQRNYV